MYFGVKLEVCYLRARGAHELRFELALEEVHYEGVVSHLVPLPRLLRHHLQRHAKIQTQSDVVVVNLKARLFIFVIFALIALPEASPPPIFQNNTYFIQPPIRVHRLSVGFVLDAVQVLVEAVQQESHELLGVVLGVTCKLTGFTGHDSLRVE